MVLKEQNIAKYFLNTVLYCTVPCSLPRIAINLMGCHQPVELILAKADVRIRKQTHANSVREQGTVQYSIV